MNIGRPTKSLYQFDQDCKMIKKWETVKQAAESFLPQDPDKTIKQIANRIRQGQYDRRMVYGCYWADTDFFVKRGY